MASYHSHPARALLPRASASLAQFVRRQLHGCKRHALAAAALLGAVAPAFAQPVIDQPDMPIDAATRSRVLLGTKKHLLEKYLDVTVAQSMADLLDQKRTSGAYESLSTAKAFVEKVTTDLRAVSHDLHLSVMYRFDGYPDFDTLPPPPPDWEEQARRANGRIYNFGFLKVEILDGNIGLIKLVGFPPPSLMAKTMAAAMTTVEYTDALIIDVSENFGGSPAAVSLFLSYFLPPQVINTNNIYYRFQNFTEKFYTTVDLPAPRYLQRELFVLTSPDTISAGEEFSYDLKLLGRATLIGGTTAGAANPAVFQRIEEHFGVSVPAGRVINPISGTNWERVGVTPDLVTPNVRAFQTAYVQALDAVLRRQPEPFLPGERVEVEKLLEEQREVLRKLPRHDPKEKHKKH